MVGASPRDRVPWAGRCRSRQTRGHAQWCRGRAPSGQSASCWLAPNAHQPIEFR